MTATTVEGLEKLKYRLNLILIALLCTTTLAPCVIFYFRGKGEFTWLLLFLGISFLVSRLPKEFYDTIQISDSLEVYRKLGVAQFKKFATNGDLINRKIKQKYPHHRNLTNLETIKNKLNETYVIERSHTVLFVFCLFTSVYACLVNSMEIAIVLFTGNIVFNYYPNLLQQYNRIRYRMVIEDYS